MNNTNKDTVIDCKSMIFSELFYKGRFEIPWHQRHYDWEKEHVSDLLRDIDEAIQQDRKCYFLGSIMLVKKSNNLWEINDGQQRMVTFSLICASICRLFQGKDTHLEALTLRVSFDLDTNHNKRLSNADDLTPRLTPPRDDKTGYNLMIRGKSIGTNGKLTTAWKEIDAFVSAMDLEKAKKFLDFLLNNVEVACLYIPKEKVDPNSVFETINCRGKHLEDFDLIRNDLYSYFSNEKQARQDTVHDSIERIRTQVGSDKRAADYSRCYFQCKYGFLPKSSFYRQTRNKIRQNSNTLVGKKKKKKPSDYTFELIEDFASKEKIDLFCRIASPDANSSFIEGFSRDSKTKVRGLSILLHELKKYTVAQPIVFALLCRYLKESDTRKKKQTAGIVHKHIKRLTSFIMRTAFVAKFEPSHFEREFSEFARQIWSLNSLKNLNTKEMLEECDDGNEGIIEDSKFIDKLTNLEIKSQKAKVFLIGLNNYEQTDRDIINAANCTVEHILPSSPKHWKGWKGFDKQDHKDWVHRLGNLTLLGQSDNKPGDKPNGSFSNKKQFLRRSAIKLNKEIVERNDWSPLEIKTRQEKLSKLAATVWNFN